MPHTSHGYYSRVAFISLKSPDCGGDYSRVASNRNTVYTMDTVAYTIDWEMFCGLHFSFCDKNILLLESSTM